MERVLHSLFDDEDEIISAGRNAMIAEHLQPWVDKMNIMTEYGFSSPDPDFEFDRDNLTINIIHTANSCAKMSPDKYGVSFDTVPGIYEAYTENDFSRCPRPVLSLYSGARQQVFHKPIMPTMYAVGLTTKDIHFHTVDSEIGNLVYEGYLRTQKPCEDASNITYIEELSVDIPTLTKGVEPFRVENLNNIKYILPGVRYNNVSVTSKSDAMSYGVTQMNEPSIEFKLEDLEKLEGIMGDVNILLPVPNKCLSGVSQDDPRFDNLVKVLRKNNPELNNMQITTFDGILTLYVRERGLDYKPWSLYHPHTYDFLDTSNPQNL